MDHRTSRLVVVAAPGAAHRRTVTVHFADADAPGVDMALSDLSAFLDGLPPPPPSAGDPGLRSVDDRRSSSDDMDDSLLRLVIELSPDDVHGTQVNLCRFDRSVDYGPVSVHDLPYIIEALIPPADHHVVPHDAER